MAFQTKLARRVRFLQTALMFLGILSLACSNSRSIKVSAANTADTGATSLNGKWTVTSQSKTSLAIVPSCKPIQPGAIFQFTDNTLEVYLPNSKTPCDVFGLRTSPTAISLIRHDMVWLCNYGLTANTLTLKSTVFFTADQTDTIPSPNNQAAASQEVVVILTKN